MGLDITISKGTKEYGEFEDKIKNDPRVLKESERTDQLRENKAPQEEINESVKRGIAQEEVVSKEVNPGYVEVYFRKVPRIIPSILMQVELERKLTPGSLVSNANAMDDDNELLRQGTLKLKNLRDAVTYMTMEKMGGLKGFFGGEDEGTKDEEIKEEFDKFFAKLEGVSEDDDISYSFSG